MSAEKPDSTDGWDAASFGAPGGQLSKAASELDGDFQAGDLPDAEDATDDSLGSD